MRIIEPYAQILFSDTSYDPMRCIEKAGRTCYKSEDKMTEDSAPEFVSRMIRSGHGAMLEHGSILLQMDHDIFDLLSCVKWAMTNDGLPCYLRFTNRDDVVSGNVRAWREFIDRLYLTGDYGEPVYPEALSPLLAEYPELFPEAVEKFPKMADLDSTVSRIIHADMLDRESRFTHQYIMTRWICDRGVSHELVRHRPASFAQESTRYCNYSKDKFGNELSFIRPPFRNELMDKMWEMTMRQTELSYLELIKTGAPTELARAVLPNSLKTEVIVTATIEEWVHIIDLRCSKAAHRQIRELAMQLKAPIERVLWDNVRVSTLGLEDMLDGETETAD